MALKKHHGMIETANGSPYALSPCGACVHIFHGKFSFFSSPA